MTIYDIAFYNVKEHRLPKEVHDELVGILEHGSVERGPVDILGLCELVGNKTPKVTTHKLIRSWRSGGQANLGAYVRHGLYKSHRWVQQQRTWRRPRHPGLGPHPARAILVITLTDGTQLVVDHFPERPHGLSAPSLIQAREEYRKDLIRVMAHGNHRARIIVGDQNASANDAILKSIAEAVPLWWKGKSVDLIGHTSNVDLMEVEYPMKAGSVPIGSDHRDYLTSRVKVRA